MSFPEIHTHNHDIPAHVCINLTIIGACVESLARSGAHVTVTANDECTTLTAVGEWLDPTVVLSVANVLNNELVALTSVRDRAEPAISAVIELDNTLHTSIHQSGILNDEVFDVPVSFSLPFGDSTQT